MGTDSVAAPGRLSPCASASGRRCAGLVPASPCLERLPPFLRLPPPVWLFAPAPRWPFPPHAKTARSRVATELASSLLLRAAPAEGSLWTAARAPPRCGFRLHLHSRGLAPSQPWQSRCCGLHLCHDPVPPDHPDPAGSGFCHHSRSASARRWPPLGQRPTICQGFKPPNHRRPSAMTGSSCPIDSSNLDYLETFREQIRSRIKSYSIMLFGK